jgi:hypothetical protein
MLFLKFEDLSVIFYIISSTPSIFDIFLISVYIFSITNLFKKFKLIKLQLHQTIQNKT